MCNGTEARPSSLTEQRDWFCLQNKPNKKDIRPWFYATVGGFPSDVDIETGDSI
jgi:hypothetical protein